jgi:hypothetical protein
MLTEPSKLPMPPERPSIERVTPDGSQPARGSSWLPIMLASLLAAVVCIVLFFLTLGGFGMVLAIGGGVFAFIGLHYVVWGWWLSRMIREEVEQEERGSEAKNPSDPKKPGRL